jgi:hypothetical protein
MCSMNDQKEKYFFSKQDFIKYFEKNIISVDIPPKNPHNGNKNDLSYIVITINMENYTQKYKKMPKKSNVKGLRVRFEADCFEENDYQYVWVEAEIKNYKLCEYGSSLDFILYKGKLIDE